MPKRISSNESRVNVTPSRPAEESCAIPSKKGNQCTIKDLTLICKGAMDVGTLFVGKISKASQEVLTARSAAADSATAGAKIAGDGVDRNHKKILVGIKERSSTVIVAPTGMSRADALRGLWDCSKPARFFETIPDGDNIRKKQEATTWESKAKVEEALKQHPYVDSIGGRCIKTDMSKYPLLDLALYLSQCEVAMTPEEVSNTCLKEQPHTNAGVMSEIVHAVTETMDSIRRTIPKVPVK